MSKHVRTTDRRPSYDFENGFEAFQSIPELRGPINPLEGHEHNDHFALIYENRAEQFATVVPFVRQGLEQDERCMYIAHDNSQEEVIAVLRDNGIDVDAALETGQLSIHSVEETYLKGGECDTDETYALLEESMEEGLAEYEGFRVTAEETWLVGDETAQEAFMACEAHVNELLDGEDSLALCQYNRNQLPPEVIEDVIETHPYLVYDDTISENFYYTPPQEYFGPARPARDNERKLRTLVDRTAARTALQTRDHYHRDLYETLADPQASFDVKLNRLLDLGCRQFDLEIGYFTRTDDDTFDIIEAVGSHDQIRTGVTDTITDTYCEKLLGSPGTIAVPDAAAEGWTDDPAYERFGLDAYFGTTIYAGGEEYGTLCFASETPRDEPFSDAEQTFLELMGQWVNYELERRRREQYLRESYEITSDPTLSFESKLERLLELGREWFGLEMAGLNHLPSWDGEFRLEKGVGLGVGPEDELWTDPGYGCFCRQTITEDEPVGMPDVRETDWEDDDIHQEFGLTSYLGTKVTGGSTPYGTLWFGSSEPRSRPFTDTERTFIDLMGQWVSYELERREQKQSQRKLYEITADNELSTDEKFERLLELGCEYLDLPVGMLTRRREEAFEIKQMRGTHPELGEGTLTPPMTDNYCRRVVDTGNPISVADAGAAGWDGDALYHEFGLECYAGVQLTVGDEAYGTICFTDVSPRDAEFTEAEQTFLDLMGQCVSYELERNHREERLQQTNDRLESFASMLAHELRNPVTIGQIYSQQLPDETDDEAVEYVTEAFDRVEDMVDVMLVLTRGREAVSECTSVHLGDVAREAWSDLDAPDATLDIAIDRTIETDETYVRHLIRNLLENAVEHGGNDVTVTVGELSEGFYVADDGVGIPADERDTIFDEGYTTAADHGGTGLGLAFVQKLADVYDWDYGVTESEDGGARFEFRTA